MNHRMHGTVRTVCEVLHRLREPTAAVLSGQGKDSFAYCKGRTTAKKKGSHDDKEKRVWATSVLEEFKP